MDKGHECKRKQLFNNFSVRARHNIKGRKHIGKARYVCMPRYRCVCLSICVLPRRLSGKESICQYRRHGFYPLLGRAPGEGNGNPLQYSFKDNPMDRGVWWAPSPWVSRIGHNWLSHTPKHTWIYLWKVKVLVTKLCLTPLTVALQNSLSMEFSMQEYWSGLLFPSPGHLLDLGVEPGSPALQADSLPSELPGKLKNMYIHIFVNIYIHTYICIHRENVT